MRQQRRVDRHLEMRPQRDAEEALQVNRLDVHPADARPVRLTVVDVDEIARPRYR